MCSVQWAAFAKRFQWMRCSIVYDMWQYTQTFLFRTLAKRNWHCCVVVSCLPGENGREHFEVFHKCTLFFPVRLQDKSFLWLLPIKVFFLPSQLLFSWRHCWCMDNGTTWCPPGLQDCRSGHWTVGSSCLEEEWQALASGGESSNQDRWWFIVWCNVYHPWVSKSPSDDRKTPQTQSHLKTFQFICACNEENYTRMVKIA